MKFKKIGLTGSTGVLGQFLKKNFKSYKFDTFNSTLTIMPDGYINLPRIRPLQVNGLSIEKTNALITP